jgi:hypothetical protein
LTIATGSVPESPGVPQVLSYDSATEVTVGWSVPTNDGGFSIESYRLYRDNELEVELNPSLNYYQIGSLDLGANLKLQVTAVNEIGESQRSTSNAIIFANVPAKPNSLVLTTSQDLSIIASWTAPTSVNGDAIRGYRVYVDDGIGGPYELVFDGFSDASTYSFKIDDLQCGLLYFV